MLLEIIDSEKVHTIQSERVTSIGKIHEGIPCAWHGHAVTLKEKPMQFTFSYDFLNESGANWGTICFNANYIPKELNGGIAIETNEQARMIMDKFKQSEQYKKDREVIESARYQMELQCPQVKQPVIRINLLK